MNPQPPSDLSYILNHLGENRQDYQNAVSPPVFQSSNFAFPRVEAMREALRDEMNSPFYTRGCNPTVAILRQKIAALEHAEDALLFASGSAAIAAGVMSQVRSGDHIICVKKPYSWTNKLLNTLLARFDVQCTMVDGTDTANFEKALQENTRLIVLESPNSLTFELQDIAAVATLAKKHGVRTIIDNSYCSPYYQNPLTLGIDMVAHSATKYLAGHSDVVIGALCGSRELMSQVFYSEYMTLGGIVSPHDAALVLRSLRTLPLRMERSHHTFLLLTRHLEQHPKIEQVLFPFLESFEQYELAKRQMRGCGGLFTIALKVETMEQVERFCNALQRFLLACSWGGHESLALPVCAFTNSTNYKNSGLPWNMVRLYVGLEEAEVLIADLEQALELV
ncbi:MAG: aminotransferase class I/II-fold pyridoxal phosphate-dependent enzyme [Sphingobacteriales bacterium]|nr:aminotransferase class I/II-fold pyridoxal phosphate-dependent enzyme [Sphingobacteriales bacterium]